MGNGPYAPKAGIRSLHKYPGSAGKSRLPYSGHGVRTFVRRPAPTRDRWRSCSKLPSAGNKWYCLFERDITRAAFGGEEAGDVRPGAWLLGRGRGLAAIGAKAA